MTFYRPKIIAEARYMVFLRFCGEGEPDIWHRQIVLCLMCKDPLQQRIRLAPLPAETSKTMSITLLLDIQELETVQGQKPA